MSLRLQERLRLTLSESRVSQGELSRLTGISSSHVSKICQGKAVCVTAETVVRIATVLGCTTDWLLGMTSSGPTPAAVQIAVAHASGRIMERAGKNSPIAPINRNAGVISKRGRVSRGPKRSVVIQPEAPPAQPKEGA